MSEKKKIYVTGTGVWYDKGVICHMHKGLVCRRKKRFSMSEKKRFSMSQAQSKENTSKVNSTI